MPIQGRDLTATLICDSLRAPLLEGSLGLCNLAGSEEGTATPWAFAIERGLQRGRQCVTERGRAAGFCGSALTGLVPNHQYSVHQLRGQDPLNTQGHAAFDDDCEGDNRSDDQWPNRPAGRLYDGCHEGPFALKQGINTVATLSITCSWLLRTVSVDNFVDKRDF